MTNLSSEEAVEIVLNQETRLQTSQHQGMMNQVVSALPLWKRSLDVLVILLSAPLTLLLGAVIAAIVKIGSPGPVIFRQERVGYKGQRFVCFKFRTMKVNAETRSHQGHTAELIRSSAPMTKLDAINDSRVIPFGSILRATGLDELPQLINVLRGEMSIVGPRPCVGYEYEMYEPWQKRRFDAVPGLTGLWQVSGKNRTTFKQMIQFDIEYSERMNLWLDLKIMFKTAPALIGQYIDQRARRREIQQGGESNRKVSTQTVVRASASRQVAPGINLAS